MRYRSFTSLFALAVVLLASTVSAQTHPCDAPTQPTEYTVTTGASTRLGFCHSGKDTNGNPVGLTGFVLLFNDTTRVNIGLLVPQGAPNANGESYYLTDASTASVGVKLQVIAVAGDESLPSAPITVIVTSLPSIPAAPSKLRIVVGE